MKMLACAHPTFDGPVILFQDIIEILHGTVFRVLEFSSRTPSALSSAMAGG
jgi:hypothetical protein